MPLNQVGFQSKLTKAIVNFEQEFERRPSAQELADILETDISKVQEALGTNGKKVSVDAPFQDDDSNSLIDIMTDESAPGTDNQMEKESLASDLELLSLRSPTANVRCSKCSSVSDETK